MGYYENIYQEQSVDNDKVYISDEDDNYSID